jgi:hypothetical protein
VSGPPFTARVAGPFNLTGCSRLPFAPKVSASTKAAVSRRDGASLKLNIRQPSAVQANMANVKVVFPSQLSPRLGTIQRACARSSFERDPASCPAGSRIGSAQARTALLGVPLSGPAYLVSDGRAAVPKLALVLQGEGVRLELEGSLTVAAGGASAIAFKGLPDAPISSLSVSLPKGPDSILGDNGLSRAKGTLCAKKLVLQTSVIGQNLRSLKASPRVTIEGCPKRRKAMAKRKAVAKRRKKAAKHKAAVKHRNKAAKGR